MSSRRTGPAPVRLRPRALLFVVVLACAGVPRATAAPRARTESQAVQRQALAVNRLSLQVSNAGSFASGPGFANGGLEFPRGSGRLLAYAGGLWIAGRVADSLRTAVTEYDTEFAPGPGTPGGPGLDTLRYRVYSVARGDTAGWGAWRARAVPLGAPLDSTGAAPGLIGDQTLWTVCTDASVTSQVYGRGPRTPVGLEVQLTAYAFDRGTALQDVVFLHYRIVHRGTAALDSAYVGIFYDADMRSADSPAASDSSLDLAYVYRTTFDALYGVAGPATGVTLLRGPRTAPGGPSMRAGSIVGYPNGADPADPAQYAATLRGRYPWGDAMLDSTTSQPTLFYAWGDPVAGTGWRMPGVIHPKVALSAGPFHFAPGDTQIVDAAIVVGQGGDRAGSILALRANAREARAAFAADFASVPPPRVSALAPLLARPNPSRGAVLFDLFVPVGGARVELDILDVLGRRVRRVEDGWRPGGVVHLAWDGATAGGRSAPAGCYFARARVAGTSYRTRIVLVR